ncbi:hypothetical protein RRF57_003146 [Xylaria bambusicola]|uniref:U4/U6.U5 small nuclear ribonucleoprotein 27kDa protein domain-containing protein n=1 Tax=Xylaria bambusicola TaxID=326684 RepID=A0AAN7ULB8_9PEZI
MADHPRRGRNRPDSRAMWDESDRQNSYDRGTRDRRDNRDRYRDSRPRSRDRRYRSRSRSPVGERRERHRSRSRDRRDRDRNYSRERRRGHESTRDKIDGRHSERDRESGRDKDREKERERERDGRRRDDDRDDRGTTRDVYTSMILLVSNLSKGPGRRGNPRRSISPRSPLGKVRRAAHDSPLPTRSKNRDGDSGHSSAGGDVDEVNRSQKGNLGRDNREDTAEDDERRGRRPNRDIESGEDAMEEDDDIAVEDDGMSAMQAMMGFGGFGTTKGQKVAGNNAGAVYKAKKTEYRQYMNRVGGFNRPLSPGR